MKDAAKDRGEEREERDEQRREGYEKDNWRFVD